MLLFNAKVNNNIPCNAVSNPSVEINDIRVLNDGVLMMLNTDYWDLQ